MGRFINADVYATTGVGLLGNNMFAYCNNNSVSLVDTTGTLPSGVKPMQVAVNDGGWPAGVYESAKELLKVQRTRERWTEFLTAESTNKPVEVLEAEYFAIYKGVPVIKAPIGRKGFSCGFILLGDEVSASPSGINTLNHAYGHYLHLKEIGITCYTSQVVIPSLIGAGMQNLGILPVYYYDQPWEFIADQYGGVDRGNYASVAPFLADFYNAYTQISSMFVFP